MSQPKPFASGFKKRHFCSFTLLVLYALAGIFFLTSCESSSGEEPKWQTDTLAEGISWNSYHGDDFFDSKQSINLIEFDLNTADAGLTVAYSDSALIKTSELARKNGALAAVNGSFFNVDAGGAVVFLKIDGEIITRGAVSRRLYSESGGIALDENGNPAIIPRPEEGWLNAEEPTILGSGPLLMINGEHRRLNNDPFNQNRHPRTAAGITEDNRFLLVTVDGRSSEAYGMSTPELREFLESLGAVSALNLDGGGSTTMWIHGQGETGVVSYPSDNGWFDHNGERGVANAVLLLPGN